MSGVPQVPYAGAPSGTHTWLPALAEFILESFSRIQIRGAAITVEHIIEARRSMNFILQGWSNRGLNLWKVAEEGFPDVCIPMTAGKSTYQIPRDTVNLLDSYVRIFTPSSTTYSVGIPLIPQTTQIGEPQVTQPYGDPQVQQPGNTLSCWQGSQYVRFRWPAHNLIPGAPIFWLTPISIGGVAVYGFSVVTEVIDWQTVEFMLPTPALETQIGQGQPPLFWTSPQSPLVGVILPGHGLGQGDPFTVAVPTAVGGAQGTTLNSVYPVVFVLNSYSFFINPTGAEIQFILTDDGGVLLSDNGIPLIVGASNNFTATAVFENGGQLAVATQQSGLRWTDIFLWPISRNDYAFLPNKTGEGRPTTYWFNRAIFPTVTLWPVPPYGAYFAFIGYRMRELEDANPMSGQGLDAPRRFFPAFAAALCASLAEKYKPEVHQPKLLLAEVAWQEAAQEDREKVEWAITPDFSGFFNS